MNVLVTGGAGFIGSHVVDKLIEENHRVFIIDNLSTGKKEFINEQANFFQMNIIDSEIENVFQNDIDFVIHLAAQIKVSDSINDPLNDAYNNIIGTLNILKMCEKYEVKKTIYISSAAEIGDPKYFPIDEKHPINPMSPYGVSKHLPIYYLKLFEEKSDFSYTILRLSNVYGPRQTAVGEGGVVAIFSEMLFQNKIPKIFGNGKQTRDFVYVEDVVSAIILAIKSEKSELYHIGSGKETTVNELFSILKESIGTNIIPKYIPKREGDIERSVFSVEKAKKELNWEPKTLLSDGLRRTIFSLRK